MNKITSIKTVNKGFGPMHYLKILLDKIFIITEVLVLIALWYFIFSKNSNFGGFSRDEMITYLIFGNLIGVISGFFFQKIVSYSIRGKEAEMLIKKPLTYLFKVVFLGFFKNIFPFLFLIVLNIGLIYIFKESFVINLERDYLLLISLMVGLAFLSELLLLYLLQMFVFWSFQNQDLFNVLWRIKKFFSGNYIPLSLLPIVFFKVSLLLPFAYAFFVPTELYLKKISYEDGLKGVWIQIGWIVVFYIVIRFICNKNNKESI